MHLVPEAEWKLPDDVADALGRYVEAVYQDGQLRRLSSHEALAARDALLCAIRRLQRER